jgi:hypothetical protein
MILLPTVNYRLERKGKKIIVIEESNQDLITLAGLRLCRALYDLEVDIIIMYD